MEHANTLPRDLQIVAIVQRLAVCADAAQVCHALAECTRKLIGADGVTVVMRDHERCRYVEENAIGELWKGQDFAIGECISGWAMLHDEQLAILDIRQDPRIPQSLYAATFVHSLAMTPIGHDPAIGAMGVYWSHEHAATDDELASLRAIADSAALALVNLRLVEELRAANARKEQFLASLAHELGALLGPLRTSLHLQGNASDLDAHRRARDIMTRQVARQARLVDHLLEGSVLLTGLASSTCVPLDLGEEITEAVRAHDAAAQAAEVRLALAPLPDRMPMLGDPARIRQALAQLLDNSVRCTPPGGDASRCPRRSSAPTRWCTWSTRESAFRRAPCRTCSNRSRARRKNRNAASPGSASA